jgi:hypothetical protein
MGSPAAAHSFGKHSFCKKLHFAAAVMKAKYQGSSIMEEENIFGKISL